MSTDPSPGAPLPDTGGPDGELYCYRCKKVLKLSPEWCGTCGAEQFNTCRNCGLVFNKIHHTCPSCGTRRRHSHRGGITRIQPEHEAFSWFRENRIKLFYIAAGITGGILVGAIVKALASQSGPPGEQNYDVTSLMYWLDPFIRAAKTVFDALIEAFRAVFNWILGLILGNFKTTILAFIGGIVGFILAARNDRKRRRSRKSKSHREARTEDPRTKAE